MTDLKPAPAWHTTTEDEIAELRRRLAEAELRIINAVAAEDFAQEAFECAKRRADRFEPALQALLIERITPQLPEALENSAEGIADCLIDDIGAGTLLDELDVDGHIASWLEER